MINFFNDRSLENLKLYKHYLIIKLDNCSTCSLKIKNTLAQDWYYDMEFRTLVTELKKIQNEINAKQKAL